MVKNGCFSSFGMHFCEELPLRSCGVLIYRREYNRNNVLCINLMYVLLCTDSGRVKVFVRVRPPRPQENSRKEPIAVNVQELSSQVS